MTQHQQSTKILLLDIENAPNTVYSWDLWPKFIPSGMVIESRYLLSYAAKWYGDSEMHYDSIHDSSPRQVLRGIYNLLDDSDIVVHYNGAKHDIPILNTEFIKIGLTPPSSYKQVDLLKTVRGQFKFPSNKLEFVAKALGIGTKIKTDFDLWVDCIAGNQVAWEKMEKYNKHDVVLLEKLYDKLMPWIKSHPNHGLYEGKDVCPNCGSSHVKLNGWEYTKAGQYRRYKCLDCGAPIRGNIKEKTKTQYRTI